LLEVGKKRVPTVSSATSLKIIFGSRPSAMATVTPEAVASLAALYQYRRFLKSLT
jgi:hypothetical protein